LNISRKDSLKPGEPAFYREGDQIVTANWTEDNTALPLKRPHEAGVTWLPHGSKVAELAIAVDPAIRLTSAYERKLIKIAMACGTGRRTISAIHGYTQKATAFGVQRRQRGRARGKLPTLPSVIAARSPPAARANPPAACGAGRQPARPG
jgi:hypothetical protein